MFVVGLTGGIGSGKSTVAEMFAALDVELVDADIAAREVVAPGTHALAEIAKHFGSEILMTDGGLDRGALRQVIFNQEKEKHWLEELLHPLIRRWLTQKISSCQTTYCLLVSPLLLETGQAELVDRILVVDVSIRYANRAHACPRWWRRAHCSRNNCIANGSKSETRTCR